jgi:lipoprotein-anchoring transpeptidase ErfK/SrfK
MRSGSNGRREIIGAVPPRKRPSAIVVALAVLIPVVPVVIGVLVVSSAADNSPAATTSAGVLHFTPVPATPPSTSSTLSPTPQFASQIAPTLSPTPPFASRIAPARGALVARLTRATTMRAAPGGRALGKLALRTGFGSPDVVLVARRSGRWLGVISQLAGNGRLGWIPEADAALRRVNFEIKVSLPARRLMVLDSGRVLKRYTIAIGRPSAPTPTGRYAVTDRLATGDPTGAYGCCIIALSAHSPHAIAGWAGGNRIAIHSTPETSTIGQPVSHGCMRLTIAEGQWLMKNIPLGTPTVISG